MRLVVLIATFTLFTVFTLSVVFNEGLFGFVTLALRERWALQLFIDLAISLFVACSFIRRDARERGLVAWPYLMASALLGSIGVLAYLVRRELAKTPRAMRVSPSSGA